MIDLKSFLEFCKIKKNYNCAVAKIDAIAATLVNKLQYMFLYVCCEKLYKCSCKVRIGIVIEKSMQDRQIEREILTVDTILNVEHQAVS